MSLLSAIIALGVLIFVHELGHFLVAKRAGVGVTTFSLGFGPRLLGIKRGETDYRLSAVPLGGFVKMVGENPGEEVPPEDRPRAFCLKPVGWRLAIVTAGPAANLIFALILFFVVLLGWGVPTLSTLVGEALPGQPAAQAGIQKGDRILAIDGHRLADWTDMVKAIQESRGRPVTMLVQRQGRRLQIRVTPRRVTTKNLFGEEVTIYRVGIQASQERLVRRVGVWEAITGAFQKTYAAGELIIMTVVKLIQRKVSVDNLGGPILIAQAASQAARYGAAPFLDLTALISVNLAILNLLPIPALDGGHIFFFLIEAVRRKPVSEKVREKATQVGMGLLLLLMLFLFYNDIARLFMGS